MKKATVFIVIISLFIMSFNLTNAAPQVIKNEYPVLSGFHSNPDQDSGWKPAGVLGGGCTPDGRCDGGAGSIRDGLYEYTPDAERVNQDPNLSVNMSQHGGHPTALGHERQICHIGNQNIGWAGGTWHHGATWRLTIDRNGNRIWDGPLNPHWAFEHRDRCVLQVTPTPTNTPTPIPTATPQPGVLTVQVFACNEPFATRITRMDTGEGHDGVASYTFTVPSEQTINIHASGYGDFDSGYVSGQAGQTIRIDMPRKANAGPCGGEPTPQPGPPPTSTPGPPCQNNTDWGLQVLNLSAPATGPQDNPGQIEAGVNTLHFNAQGILGEGVGTVIINLYDVTSGTRMDIAQSVWNRPFNGEIPGSRNFARGTQRGFSNIETSHGGGWDWKTGWINLQTPALQAGHTYEIFVKFIQGFSCTSFLYLENANYIEVANPDITVQIRNATLLGQDDGPRSNHLIQIDRQTAGNTDEHGAFMYSIAAPAPERLSITPNLPEQTFLWKVDGSCEILEQNLDTGSIEIAGTGGCDVIFTYIPIPHLSGRAYFRNIGSTTYQPMNQGTLVLVSGSGDTIRTKQIRGGGLIDIGLTGSQLRPLVGNTSWSLSFDPPPKQPAWIQTTPVAGSAGDSISNDLAITFVPGDSTDNRFFVEQDPTIVHVLTIGGSVRLNTQEGTTTYGPYGTVQVWWSLYNSSKASVKADGTWEVQIPRLGYTPTLRLQFIKNLPMALYDSAEVGRVNDEIQGQVVSPYQIEQIEIPSDGVGRGYNFVLRELPPPPPPPVASGEIELLIHSHLDPQQGVYQTEDQVFSWPHGETLDFAPIVELDPLPPPTVPGYHYEQRIVAWSFESSLDMQAKSDTDALGRTGCRVKDAPPASAGDTSRLRGCVYRYRESPSAEQMIQQGRIHWSLITPRALPANVYSYALRQFHSTDLKLNVLVETSVINILTGEHWDAQQVLSGTFKADLVMPRTTK